MGNNYNSNGQHGVAYIVKYPDELVVSVDVPAYIPPNRKPIPGQRHLNQPADSFIDSLVNTLPEGAIKPRHFSTPDMLIVGSPQFGYVITVRKDYEAQLIAAIAGMTH